MTFYPGDLVRVLSQGSALAVVDDRECDEYSIKSRTIDKIAWYRQDELQLVERGHYAKHLITAEDKKRFKDSWGFSMFEEEDESDC